MLILKLNRYQEMMVKDWLKCGLQADKDAYDDGLEPYPLTKKEMEKEWKGILDQLKKKRKKKPKRPSTI